ncbi:MAG: hypothetical protein PHV82_19230 [Victivallaceae bacterium]|nr:hypothetical protein [Victivallaceae bacterium]
MIFDINISWGHWPFYEIGYGSAEKLKSFLRSNGIEGGLIRAAEAAFAPDLERCNAKLFAAFKGNDNFIPVPTVNPVYPQCTQLLDSGQSLPAAVAVYPGYHDYSVLSAEFAILAGALENLNITLLIAVRQEDERQHYKFCRIPAVPVAEINELGRKFPKLRIIALNCYFGELKKLLPDAPNICADIAFAEMLNTLRAILQDVDYRQLVFGSHTPFFYTVPALMKLKDARLDEKILNAVTGGNVQNQFNIS